MQIMPKTGKKLYSTGPTGDSFETDLLYDPELNIELGIKYLNQLSREVGNDPAHILASYNAGPHVLKIWLKRFAHIKDPHMFIESIPYPETRNYVKRVLRNYGIYKALYRPQPSPENH